MRYFPAFVIPFLVACSSSVPTSVADPLANVYTLESVDTDSLPAPADHASASRWVLSGSLTLQPDGYYVLAERDSIWNGRSFTRDERREGGTWIADGSLLTLSDTTTETIDTYGPGAETYFGSVAPHTVLLTVAADDGTAPHIYRYER
jgi:hypothetical protein